LLRIPGALLGAALFALHPVNVESVAWITQLKNTLSLALTLLSVLLYLLHEQRGGRRLFAASVAAFAMATLAKGMTLMLPVVLLACAWWQRGRIDRRDLLRVVPFLLIGAAMVGMEIYQQHSVAGETVVRSDSFFSRTAVAGCAVWFYLWKLVWPVNLMFVYPKWHLDAVNWRWFLPGLLLAALLVLLAVLAGLTWQQSRMYADKEVLYRTIMRQNPECWMAYNNLGTVLVNRGRSDEGIAQYREALRLKPNHASAHNNLANALAGVGQIDEAIEHYQKALQLSPKYAEAHYNLGHTLARCGRVDEAMAQYEKALQIKPSYAEAHNDLAGRFLGGPWTDRRGHRAL
jgi:tetratricopeptide (TPR) repeat protein